MCISEGAREVLCLTNAFKEIKSPGTRLAVLLLIEELAQKDDPLVPKRFPPTFQRTGVD